MRALTPLLLIVALALGAAPIAGGAEMVLTELRLNTGEVVIGELVKQDDQVVVIKRTFRNKGREVSAQMTYQRGMIESMVEKNPEDEYAKRLKKMPPTAGGNCDMADWCLLNRLKDEAITHAKNAAAIDKECERAKSLLRTAGYVEVDGVWLDDEQLNAKGLERVGDGVMTAAEAEEYRRKNQKLFARNDLRNKLEACRASIARQAKEYEISSEKLTKAQGDLGSAQVQADQAKARADAAEKQVASAEAAYASAQAAAQSNANGGINQNANAQDLVHAAEAAVRAAKTARDQAKSDADAAGRKLPALKREVDRLKVSVPALEEKINKAKENEKELVAKVEAAERAVANEETAEMLKKQ